MITVTGEPNGNRLENCVVLWPHKKGWNDVDCNSKAIGFCDIQPRPRFLMRGKKELRNFSKKDSLQVIFSNRDTIKSEI